MSRHMALLRGINVGGRNRLPMVDLVSIFESLGYRDVRTVAQSGNVVFAPPDPSVGANARAIAASIADSIAERHGFRPQVMVLSPNALRTAIDRNPFPAADGRALHFFFLESPPIVPDPASLEARKRPSERIALDGSVLYLHAPDGFARSKIASTVEQSLGVAATARNWNTVKKLEMMLDRA
ncbi:MAG: DUF1697 domain-containing protein [Candidatus Wenzhouxiangella sp. M2_3B_020]